MLNVIFLSFINHLVFNEGSHNAVKSETRYRCRVHEDLLVREDFPGHRVIRGFLETKGHQELKVMLDLKVHPVHRVS